MCVCVCTSLKDVCVCVCGMFNSYMCTRDHQTTNNTHTKNQKLTRSAGFAGNTPPPSRHMRALDGHTHTHSDIPDKHSFACLPASGYATMCSVTTTSHLIGSERFLFFQMHMYIERIFICVCVFH